ncbi:MAG: hypothetical protein QOD78_297 [Chloroflexota bacterium]|jgi:hypothetical protein|nr:hypothetical protein [Chloroflexota bacterium]
MITTRIQTTTRLFIATISLAAVALAFVAAPAAGAAGLRNCVDITGPQSGRAGCYEDVWADGVEYRMTFSNTRFSGATPKELDPFYVLAAQTDRPQGAPPNTFSHDHVVRAVPSQNNGTYSVQMQGFFVLCSGQGIVSGACVPAWTSLGGDPMPFAKSVDGQPLTSTEAIESAANAGDLALINLGPGAVVVGAVTRGN